MRHCNYNDGIHDFTSGILRAIHMKYISILLSAIILSGCSGAAKGFLKSIEGKAYDAAAKGASEYCERIALSSETSPQARALVNRERVEARREIRQRGTYGPIAEDSNQGPVVIIWCEGDRLPDNWQKYLDKNL